MQNFFAGTGSPYSHIINKFLLEKTALKSSATRPRYLQVRRNSLLTGIRAA